MLKEINKNIYYEAIRKIKKDKLALTAFWIIVIYIILAFLIQCKIVAFNYDKEVGLSYENPSFKHLFGTDIFGRDVFIRAIYAIKISMSVGLIASLIAIPIGVILGAIAGFFGKKVDEFIVWLYSTIASIPGLLLILAFSLVLKDKVIFGIQLKGIYTVYLAIGLTSWVGICRLIRAEVMKHKKREYVLAAQALGASSWRQIFIHILPNVFHLILIEFSLEFVYAIKSEVIISYLGLGVQNLPSWGIMISDAKQELARGIWWQLAAASLFMFIIVLSLNIFIDALREAIDPKMKK
ncbi:MAG: ABC transporter permease [bacterium]